MPVPTIFGRCRRLLELLSRERRWLTADEVLENLGDLYRSRTEALKDLVALSWARLAEFKRVEVGGRTVAMFKISEEGEHYVRYGERPRLRIRV